MSPRRARCSAPLWVLLPWCAALAGADNASQAYYTALLNVTVLSPERGGPALLRLDRGRYGQDSPKVEVRGLLVAPGPINGVADRLGCDPRTRFNVPPNTKQWIALLQRGNCTFREKILRAASHNATAVVIYNNVSSEEPVTMTHQGTGDIVAVMITESKVKEILNYLEKNISVLMAIAVGARVPPKNFSRGSLVFVSISFIVLMIISSAWLIFYFIQKIRYTSARDRNQRRLGDAAKKAIGKLATRTVKKGDKETDPDFDHCAVCIESYKQNDVVRILPCKNPDTDHSSAPAPRCRCPKIPGSPWPRPPASLPAAAQSQPPGCTPCPHGSCPQQWMQGRQAGVLGQWGLVQRRQPEGAPTLGAAWKWSLPRARSSLLTSLCPPLFQPFSPFLFLPLHPGCTL